MGVWFLSSFFGNYMAGKETPNQIQSLRDRKDMHVTGGAAWLFVTGADGFLGAWVGAPAGWLGSFYPQMSNGVFWGLCAAIAFLNGAR